MTNRTFELSVEQIDMIMVEELKEAYDMNVNASGEVGTPNLTDAIRTVLQYYMAPSEYDRWENSLK